MKTFFIRTYGCQMNELDSELVIGLLKKRGLKRVFLEKNADLILFNTCSIRDLAERKIMGKLGLLSRKKKKAVIGILGCMVMTKKKKLLEKFENIDFILGTNNILDINNILDEIISKKTKISKISEKKENFSKKNFPLYQRSHKVKAYISIIKGCNNFCSYCIVPFTRGREVSRDIKSIEEECLHLRDQGYKEITLLGQNVNSYQINTPSKKIKFPDLLYQLDKIEGIERIRFLTSHPKDFSKELMFAIRDLKALCEFIHLPVQSGSNKILKKMNRFYTKEKYLKIVENLKKIIKNISFGTDIIVGFPGETEKDFLETLNLFKEVKFTQAFIFAYSKRKGTAAYNLKELDEKVKKERLQILLKLYKDILKQESKKFLNSRLEVLVDNFNKEKYLKGKTRCFKKVIFKGNENLIGTLQNIQLKNYKNDTFIGEI
jgi:tRNA-2-methylthio-N6-dimethylallyladenosine synthase